MFPIEQRATYAAQLHVGVQQMRQRLGRGQHVGLICVAAPGQREQGVRPARRDALDDALQFDEVAVLAAPTDESKMWGFGRRQTRVAENFNAGFGHVGSKIGRGHSGDVHFVTRPHRCRLFFAQFNKNAIARILHKKEVVARIEVGHHGAQVHRVGACGGAQRQPMYFKGSRQRGTRGRCLVPVLDLDAVN